MSRYQERVFSILRDALSPVAPVRSALDFGCGDGWYTAALAREGLCREALGVDVKRRERTHVEPLLYDGITLPFSSRSFELVFSADALHHCPDPRSSLHEMARCAARWVLLKDHVYGSPAGYAALAVLDELGNRRFGIPSPHRYQRAWEWDGWLRAEGFRCRRVVHPAPCHVGPLGLATNGLQFVSLWERAA